MSYLALARKWRPAQFSEVVGQSHVLTALGNALAQNRLHHAYLFSGTRGVGKTTIGRLFAKGLNCETGITAQPCGQCSTCREIDQGRFVDLLEIDAASRTRIEDTRELLDNVQYKPARGRFKVYLIDEVHMLSRHSFNALLKTLEEPPEYVKFLLATTDPQKLPVTILSRCLQFHLKPISVEHIEQQLAFILQAEGVESHPRALGLIAHAADGSMRDALSLTDQAIALGNGLVSDDTVSHMLGTIDTDQALHLIQALSDKQAQQVIDCVAMMASNGVEWDELLQTLASQLHRIAMYQMLPSVLDKASPDAEKIKQLAQVLSPEDVQLFYQIALKGREDLSLSPTPRIGLEMILLRMVAFRPETISPVHSVSTSTEAVSAASPPLSHDMMHATSTSPMTTSAPVSLPSFSDEGASDDGVSVSEAETRIESAMPPAQTSLSQEDESERSMRPTMSSTDVGASEKPATPAASGTVGLRHQLRSQRIAQKSGEQSPPQSFLMPSDGAAQRPHVEGHGGAEGRRHAQSRHQGHQGVQPPSTSSSVPQTSGVPHQSDASSPVRSSGGDSPKKSNPAASKAPSVFERLTQKRHNDGMPVSSGDETLTSEPAPEAPYQWRPSKVQETPPPSHLTPAELKASLEHEKTPEMMAKLVEEVIEEDEWAALIHQLDIPKLVEQLALNSFYERNDAMVRLTLRESQAHLNTEKSRATLNEALNAVLGCSCQLSIGIGDDGGVTPLEKREQHYQSKLTQAFENLNADPNVQWIQQRFQGQLDKTSVRPI